MRVCAALVIWLYPVCVFAQADDDPGISSSVVDDEPFPEPVSAAPPAPPVAGMVDDPGIGSGPAIVRAIKRHAALLEGIKVRLAYRTFTLPEATSTGTATQRFHSVALDVYPISWYIRLGLSSQFAFETDSPNHDWLATEGVTVGFQVPGKLTPYIDGGVQVGLGKRAFYVPEIDYTQDSLTLVWAYTGEVGVDFKIAGGAKGSAGIGLQRTEYFSNGTQQDPISTTSDTTVTFKIGFGF